MNYWLGTSGCGTIIGSSTNTGKFKGLHEGEDITDRYDGCGASDLGRDQRGLTGSTFLRCGA
jgi:hypothetical protein